VTLRVVASFDRHWTVFWATTYTFELPFFESFLLPRLGEPPLNATILVDAKRLADAVQDLAGDTPWRGARANRDYLVRGVAPTRGAFHPKTYFFGNYRTGVLLVGSGNLTMSGLESGKEAFTRFDAADPADLGSIHAWRDWMESLVSVIADDAVTDRWRNAQLRAPWIVGRSEPAAFVDNWTRPILDTFLDGVEAPVDELHLTAPFYDEHANAVRTLVERAAPRRISVLLARDASVHGPALLDVLGRSGAEVTLHGLEPDLFVHGKLIGVVWQGRGRLLSGSANLSGAALLRAASADPLANVECGAIADVDPEAVGMAFLPPPPPPGLRLTERTLDSLSSLRFVRSDDAGHPPHLRSAAWLEDRRIRIDVSVTIDAGVRLSNGTITTALQGPVTEMPFADDTGRFAWLVDDAGRQVSNKVAIDEPARLQLALAEPRERSDRPAGVEAADLETPVGQMLARLHSSCIFDFDETPAAQRGRRSDTTESEDPEFWDRLAREELRRDPRAARYHQLGGPTPMLDGIFLDIALMLEMVPGLEGPHRLPGSHNEGDRSGTGNRWTPDRRLQVRLFNVLARWCTALADPRLEWNGVLTPVGNFAALLGALRECWIRDYLPEPRVVALVGVLLTAFVRGEGRPGFLSRQDDDHRAEVLATLATSVTPSIAGALVYAAVRPAQKDFLSFLFAWQPALTDGLKSDVLRADFTTASTVEELIGSPVSPAAIGQRLAWASTYTNDEHWSETVSRETRLQVVLTSAAFAAQFGATLRVGPEVDLLGDPRVVRIVWRALAYRRTQGCIVESGPNRLSVRLGDVVAARINGATVVSDDPLTAERLEAMAMAGAPFAELFWVSEEVAS
jgi:hypothetical protein